MSSSSTSTFPFSRVTPRKFRSKKKTLADWAASSVEGCGDNGQPLILKEHPKKMTSDPILDDTNWFREDGQTYIPSGSSVSRTNHGNQTQIHTNQVASADGGYLFEQDRRTSALGVSTRRVPKAKGTFYDADGHIFSKKMTEYILERMLNEVENGRPNGGVFHSSAWTGILDDLVAKFNKPFKLESLINKGRMIKKEYSEFMKLKHSVTGIGWNHELDIPVMSSEWWDTYVKANPGTGKYRYDTLPNYETLHKIFHGQVATGKYSQSSMVPLNEDGSLNPELEGLHSESIGPRRMSLDTQQTSSARIPGPVSKNKKQRTISGGISFATAVKSWEESSAAKVESRRLRNAHYTGVGINCHAPPPASSDHEACMEKLEAMNGVDAIAFAAACVSFKDVNHRRVFAAIRDEQRRLDWVYNHQRVSYPTPPTTPMYVQRPCENPSDCSGSAQ